MTDDNTCQGGCTFDTNQAGLYRTEGGANIEQQLDQYITENLPGCVGDFDEYRKQGCTVTELSEPTVTSNVATEDVFFVGQYPLRITCDDQSFDLNDYYVNIDLNLKEMYDLAVNLTNLQAQNAFLEQATLLLLSTYGGLDSNRLPPFRQMLFGGSLDTVYWVKSRVIETIQGLLSSHIPLIQKYSGPISNLQ